ncbi:hypothetical protein BLNAU_5465 [Blattamonas nauphoetae]|uniref:Uncharacterized protein n=1 Tax=Blattamonas nauphoetae TaxID=2049346 RepID=A0ABQ9Y7I9_9EUKA|nr:hypothetical protein BLNAU_5465 [Blattamonas nauphoetae]
MVVDELSGLARLSKLPTSTRDFAGDSFDAATTVAHDASPSTTRPDLASAPLPFPLDSSPFLNWREDQEVSEDETAVVFRSLVATVKLQPALDASLEAKAVKFLESVDPENLESVDDILPTFASPSDESLTGLTQCIVVLVSSPMQLIVSTSMKILVNMIGSCSAKVRRTLVNADLIPQLIITLNPPSLSFTEAENIHTYLLSSLTSCVMLATPYGLTDLEIEEGDEQQAVHETVFKQILAPSEQYIRHLCVNRNSIVDGDQSGEFVHIISQLLEISPFYQPTMDFVRSLPVFLSLPNCLTIFDNDDTIFQFYEVLRYSVEQWNEKGGDIDRSGTKIIRSLRLEGIDDVLEQRLQNDGAEIRGDAIVDYSIMLNISLGMNIEDVQLNQTIPNFNGNSPILRFLCILARFPFTCHSTKNPRDKMWKGAIRNSFFHHGSSRSSLVDFYCSTPFLNWSEDDLESDHEKTIVFRSLVAHVKSQPAFDVSLEAKAVKFLESVDADDEESTDDLLTSLASRSDESLTELIQSIVILISSPSQVITTASMKMLDNLISSCSVQVRRTLVKADLVPHLIVALNPTSLSFAEAADMHVALLNIIRNTFWLSSPTSLGQLGIKDGDEQQAVRKAVLKQVLAPSEQYIRHLCVNRFSVLDRWQSMHFLVFLAQLLRISSYDQLTMEFVVVLPVFLTIPSCLTFFESERSLHFFLVILTPSQRQLNEESGDFRRLGTKIIGSLRTEGMDDVMEQRLQNDETTFFGKGIATDTLSLNAVTGMNLQKRH